MTPSVTQDVKKETDPNVQVANHSTSRPTWAGMEAQHSSGELHLGQGKAGRVELGAETNINDGPWRPLCLPRESRPPPQQLPA